MYDYSERLARIERGLRNLGLIQCDECQEYVHYIIHRHRKVANSIVNVMLCPTCEHELGIRDILC